MSAEWFGSPPEWWLRAPLGYFFDERREVVSDREFRALSVSKAGVTPQLENVAKTSNNDARKLVRAGDIAINSRSDRKGSSGLSTLTGSVSVITTVLKPRGIDGRFAHHLIRSEAFQEQFYRFGSGIVADLWSTRWAAMKQIPLAVPPKPEQLAIAEYLDRETAEIDAFIADQEELIALLIERRAATISRAVTRGIDGAMELRESAVEFLGAVPRHWNVWPVISLGSVLTSTVDKKSYDGEQPVRLCNYTDVYYNDEIVEGPNYMSATASPEQIAKFSVRAGDVAITKDSESADDIGIPAIVPNSMPGHVWGYHLSIYRLRDRRYSRYVKRLFESSYVKAALAVRTPGVTRVGLSQNTLRYLRVPIPPVSEAIAIADYLDHETAEIDAAIADAREAIALSKERRAALISAAVTGQIDVTRGAAA